MEVCGQCHALATLPLQRDTVSIIQEAGWVPGLVQLGTENLSDTEI